MDWIKDIVFVIYAEAAGGETILNSVVNNDSL
jgi:hypothetical protein